MTKPMAQRKTFINRIVANSCDGSARILQLIVSACMVAFVASALSGCAWWDEKERRMVLRPTPGRPADFSGLRQGDEAYSIDVAGKAPGEIDKIQVWWLPNGNTQAPALLYLHGTF